MYLHRHAFCAFLCESNFCINLFCQSVVVVCTCSSSVNHASSYLIQSVITKLTTAYSKIDRLQLVSLVNELERDDDSVAFVSTDVQRRSDIVADTRWMARLSAAQRSGVEDAELKLAVADADLLVVYQSAEMRRLYRRYGNLLIVLDAVHRDGRYELPVFFLMVRTNVNYQVIAVIALQQETQQCLVNALNVVRSWNPDTRPRFALVDCFDEGLAALEVTFPG